jgi:DnaJ-class molecular chaperone
MGGEYEIMKKIICEDCRGYGYFKIDNIHESCQMCNGNGYHLYLEEGEEFGDDCRSGKCN